MAYLDKSRDWGGRLAPTLEEIESLARLNFSKLPEKLRLLCLDVTVRVADFPEDAIVEDMGLESPFELLSMFEGPGLGARFSLSAVKRRKAKSRVWLFRRPILDYWTENDETLDEIISYLLLQELGRPFGYSDEETESAVSAA